VVLSLGGLICSVPLLIILYLVVLRIVIVYIYSVCLHASPPPSAGAKSAKLTYQPIEILSCIWACDLQPKLHGAHLYFATVPDCRQIC